MANDGSVVIKIDGDDSGFKATLQKLGKVAQGAAKSVLNAVGGLSKAFAGAAVAAGGLGIHYNAQMEQLQTSFEVMTGSAEKAARVTEQLKKTAANTPFELSDLAETTQLLMNYGLKADDAMGKMTMLGDIAQGDADKMQRVAAAYGQMSSAGKVQLEDIKQMIDAGFNPLQEISETTGESMASLYDRISAGRISVDEITSSMERSTAAGGKYFQSMEKQSKTLSGQLSTLKDHAMELFGAIAEEATSAIRDTVLPELTNMVAKLQSAFEIGHGKGFVVMLGAVFTDAAGQINEALPAVVSAASEVVNALLLTIGSHAPALAGSAIGISQALLMGFLDVLPTFGNTGAIWIASLMTGIGEALPAIIPKAAEAVAAFAQGLVGYAPLLAESALTLAEGLVSGLVNAITGGVESADFSGIGAALGGLWETLAPFARNVGEGLLFFLQNVLVPLGTWAAGEALPLFLNALTEGLAILSTALEIAKPFFAWLWDSFLQPLATWAGGGISVILEGIVSALTHFSNWISANRTAVQDIVIVIGSFMAVWAAANAVVMIRGLVTAIAAFIAAGGPAAVVATVLGGAIQFLISPIGIVVVAIGALIAVIVLIVKHWDELKAAALTAWQVVQDACAKAAVVVKQTAVAIKDALVKKLGELPGELLALGKRIIQGLGEGIKSGIEWAKGIVADVASSLIGTIKSVLGIHSPSKAFAQIGEFSMRGLAIGMKDESGNVIKTAKELSQAVLQAATEWVDDKRSYDALAAKDEIHFWEELVRIGGLGAAELATVNKKLYSAKKSASKEAYEQSKKWIDKEKFYNRMSAEEELAAWERVTSRKNLLAEEQADAERNLYSAQQAVLSAQQAGLDDYQKSLDSRVASLQSFAGLFDEIEGKNDASGRKLLENLRGQVDAFKNWQADMEALAERGVTGDLLTELQELGPKAADKIRALTQLSDTELTEYAALFTEKGRLASEQAAQEIPPVVIPLMLGELGSAASDSGADVLSAFTDNAAQSTEKVSDVAGRTMAAFTNAVLSKLGMVGESAGAVMNSFCRSVSNEQPSIVSQSNSTVRSFCNTVRSKHGEFYAVGADAMNGLDAGLREGGQLAISTAQEIANEILFAMQSALDIHSPSRKMAKLVGAPAAAGIGVGFQQAMPDVLAQMRKAVNTETLRVSANVAASAQQPAAVRQNAQQAIIQRERVEKLAAVNITGDMAMFARSATPYIMKEIKRIGPSMLTGGTA